MPPLIMHAVIILCALSIKHKYPANRCAGIYLLVSMRQVERENTRWNLLHPGVLWCTCLASMSRRCTIAHMLLRQSRPAGRARGRRPTNSYFYANAPLQIQIDRKLSDVGPFGRQTTQNALCMCIRCTQSSRRIAGCCWRMQFPCSIYGWCAHFHPGIFHIYCALCIICCFLGQLGPEIDVFSSSFLQFYLFTSEDDYRSDGNFLFTVMVGWNPRT